MGVKYIIGIVIALIVITIIIYYSVSSSSSSGNSTTPSSPPSPPGGGCSPACASGQTCVTIGGQKMCQLQCSTDKDCDNGNTCINNVCSCNSGAACTDGITCNGTQCVTTCTTSTTCQNGMTCDKTGQCSCNGTTCTGSNYCGRNKSGVYECTGECGTTGRACDQMTESCVTINGVDSCQPLCGSIVCTNTATQACNGTVCADFCGSNTTFCTSSETCVGTGAAAKCVANCGTPGGTYCATDGYLCSASDTTGQCFPKCGSVPCDPSKNTCVSNEDTANPSYECNPHCPSNTAGNGAACAFGLFCDDPIGCQTPGCGTSDTSCGTKNGEQLYCYDGTCVTIDQYCSPACADDLVCVNRQCQVAGCLPVCTTGNRCVQADTGVECIPDSQYCDPACINKNAYTCINSTCYFNAHTCPIGADGKVVPAPSGQICINGEYIPSTTTCAENPYICSPGQYCKNGVCTSITFCPQGTECDDNHLCVDGICAEKCLLSNGANCSDTNAICISYEAYENPYGYDVTFAGNVPEKGSSVTLDNVGFCGYGNKSSMSTLVTSGAATIICDSDSNCPQNFSCNSSYTCVSNNTYTPQYSWIPIDITNTTTPPAANSCDINGTSGSMPLGCFYYTNSSFSPNVAGGGFNTVLVNDTNSESMYLTPVVFKMSNVSDTATCPLLNVPIPGSYVASNGTNIKSGFTSFNLTSNEDTVWNTNRPEGGPWLTWDTNGPVSESNPFSGCKVTSAAYLSNDTITTNGNSKYYHFNIIGQNVCKFLPTANPNEHMLWYDGMPIFGTNDFGVFTTAGDSEALYSGAFGASSVNIGRVYANVEDINNCILSVKS